MPVVRWFVWYHSKSVPVNTNKVNKGNDESKTIGEELARQNITSDTVLGTELVGKLIADLGKDGDILDKKTAKAFIKSLFEELNVPVTSKDLNTIIKYCAGENNTISKTNLQSVIVRFLPKSEYDI